MKKTIAEEKNLTLRNILIAIVVILFFSGIILMYYSMLYSEKRDNIIKDGEMTAKESADQIDQYLTKNSDSVKLAAYTLDEMLVENRSDEEIQDYLVGQSTAVRSAVIENHTGLYGYINGKFVSGTNWEPPEGYKPTERPWYTRPLEHPGEITILDPYVDMQTGNVMLALGKTLCDGESVISVDVSLNQIQKLAEDAVKDGDSDLEMILNDKGVVVAHSDIREIGKNYGKESGSLGADLFSTLDKADNYYFEFEYGGSKYIVYVADIQNGWYCISVKNATQVFHSLNSTVIVTIAVVIAIVLIIGVIMTRSNRYLHMSAKAMAENEAKSALLSNMSHEIRTPINTMLGMNEMILRESNDATILAYSENVKTAGRNLLGLVNDILDFSKIEAGKMEIIPVDYDLSLVLNDLVNMVNSRADRKGIRVDCLFDEQTPRLLHGDEARLKQVITNILTNAVKYTRKGSIIFSLGFNVIEDDSAHILLNVSVKDTGIGIRQEDIEKLFTEFERVDEDKNRNIEGTGLGLSITRSLLQMMDSDLIVESVYGEGSTFGFSVKQKVNSWEPLGDYKTASRDKIIGKDRYHERFTAPDAKILIVDDNPMNLMVFKSLVKKTEVKIDAANSGDEGIRYTKNGKYDLIFLDHMMPEKDGVETLNEIRNHANNPNVETPVVCLTANAISGAREKYLDAGFDDYLTKPIDPIRLEDMMYDYLPKEKIKAVEGTVSEEKNTGAFEAAGLTGVLSKYAIDVNAGIRNSGSLDSYIELLRIFYRSIDEKAEELNRFYSDMDLKNYTIKVHSLKSSARIIGADEFGETAQNLESAGKKDDLNYILANHESFMDAFVSFKEPLSLALSAYETTKIKPEADDAFLHSVFEEIREGAKEMDCERLDWIFTEMSEYSIPADKKEVYEKVKFASDHYDYKGILDALKLLD